MSPVVIWPCIAGLMLLIVGLFTVRGEWRAAHGMDKLIIMGRVLYAAPLAAFGAEHLSAPRSLMQVVPPWMPGRLFWAYFFGFALIAGSISLVARVQTNLTGALLAVMFSLFVLLIHIPRLAIDPRDRVSLAVVLRDLSFAAGGLALATRGRLLMLARMVIALAVIVFGVEHLLHPDFAPGVPLNKLMPAWVPVRPFWGYATGTVLLVAGIAMLLNRRVRTAAAWVGLVMTVLTVFLYMPILVMDPPAQMLDGVNYVADTLLFGGTVLVLAAAVPR